MRGVVFRLTGPPRACLPGSAGFVVAMAYQKSVPDPVRGPH